MSESTNNNGVGFFGLLGITFIVLKLCKVVTWSWWVVLLPIYGGIVLTALFFGGLLLWATWKDKKEAETRSKKVEEVTGPSNPVKKSKFQERLEEMQRQQKEKYNNN